MNRPDYDIAITLAHENREQVAPLVAALKDRGYSIFYYENEVSTLWGSNLHDFLFDVYFSKARFCLIVVSKEYAAKVWTNFERQAAQARSLFQANEKYLLPIRIDDTILPGLPKTIASVDIALGAAKIADIITLTVGSPQ